MDHGLRRRLQRLTTPSGQFCVAAVDHRDALVNEFAAHGGRNGPERDAESTAEAVATVGATVGAETLTAFKADVIRSLGDRPSAVMIEPEFSFPHLTDGGLIDRSVGVICALESQGYLAQPDQGNDLLPGWTPQQAVTAGADGAKLLVLYRPDDDDLAPRQERLVRRVVEDCAAAQLPVLIEPVPYRLNGPDDRRDTVLRSAERLQSFGPMILKLPYPGHGACAWLTEACGDRPWTLLSWGVGFDEFEDQFAEAVDGGCSGFTVGRALWREALPVAGRAEVLSTVVSDRFDRLCRLAADATPWHRRFGPPGLDDWPWAQP